MAKDGTRTEKNGRYVRWSTPVSAVMIGLIVSVIVIPITAWAVMSAFEVPMDIKMLVFVVSTLIISCIVAIMDIVISRKKVRLTKPIQRKVRLKNAERKT